MFVNAIATAFFATATSIAATTRPLVDGDFDHDARADIAELVAAAGGYELIV